MRILFSKLHLVTHKEFFFLYMDLCIAGRADVGVVELGAENIQNTHSHCEDSDQGNWLWLFSTENPLTVNVSFLWKKN